MPPTDPAAARLEMARWRIAATYALPHDALTGSTPAELEASAHALLAAQRLARHAPETAR